MPYMELNESQLNTLSFCAGALETGSTIILLKNDETVE